MILPTSLCFRKNDRTGVALYNDYIVCCNCDYIGVMKSSIDDLKHQQLQLNLQHRTA